MTLTQVTWTSKFIPFKYKIIFGHIKHEWSWIVSIQKTQKHLTNCDIVFLSDKISCLAEFTNQFWTLQGSKVNERSVSKFIVNSEQQECKVPPVEPDIHHQVLSSKLAIGLLDPVLFWQKVWRVAFPPSLPFDLWFEHQSLKDGFRFPKFLVILAASSLCLFCLKSASMSSSDLVIFLQLLLSPLSLEVWGCVFSTLNSSQT